MIGGRALGPVAIGAAAVAASIVVTPFFAATTFLGDDHVFLAFARHARHPLVPFVVDQHGGEYYRPVPMFVWWLLGRAGAGSVPFATLALGLHVAAALLVAGLLRARGRPRAVFLAAGVLMGLAPQNLDAAYWFAASTDLFATVFVLSSLLALVRGRRSASTLLAAGAYLSKESALILPLLALVVLDLPWRRRLSITAPHLALAVGVVGARTLVLHGIGGSGDVRADAVGRGLQIASGLSHVFTGQGLLPEGLAFAVGTTIMALAAWAAVRRMGVGATPFLFTAVGLVPVAAAGWAVGARYFYLPAVGIAWAVAEALAGVGPAARITLAGLLVVLGAAQATRRRQEIASYDQRVAAARRSVSTGVAAGHRIFHIDGGIKDLDLAVKEDPALAAAANDLLILNDVPASFAIIPPQLTNAAAIVVASPPIPPSGGYRFGDVQVVGLARRGDEPSLEEVVGRFPDIRFIRLRPTPNGRVIARDLTDQIKGRLDAADVDGQN